MQSEINVPIILDAVRQAGDFFLKDHKKTVIPPDRAYLSQQLQVIDEQCLAVLKASLTTTFPQTPWQVGDEFDQVGQKQPLDLPEYWLCDAMDGAIQYVQHLPGWTVNLVLIRDGCPHFAAVYAPLEQEMFWAEKGAGAFMNDALIKPGIKTDLSDMIAVFNYGHQADPVPGLNQRIGASVTDLLNHVGVVRNYGPHGLQLAQTGAGRIDLFCQEGMDTYNWLAGILIAKEAGAEILTTDGQPWTWGDNSLLVAGPGIADRFLNAKSVSLASSIS